MHIEVDPQKIKKTSWKEAAIRFAMGGAITVVAGLIAKKWGPGIGGLFLAFPAILPAACTLIEKHEKSRRASGVDAWGACIGAIGLAAFGGVVWASAAKLNPRLVLLLACAAWFLLSAAIWWLRRCVLHQGLAHQSAGRPRRRSSNPTT